MPGFVQCFSAAGNTIRSYRRGRVHAEQNYGENLLRILSFVMFGLTSFMGVMYLASFINAPSAAKLDITDASLTQFNFTTIPLPNNPKDNSTIYSNLDYNLDLIVTAQNLNKDYSIQYDLLQVTAYYLKKRFGSVNFTSSTEEGSNTSHLIAVPLKGKHVIVFDDQDGDRFTGATNYSIDVQFYLEYWYLYNYVFGVRLWVFGLETSNITCNLEELPLTTINNGESDPISNNRTSYISKCCDHQRYGRHISHLTLALIFMAMSVGFLILYGKLTRSYITDSRMPLLG